MANEKLSNETRAEKAARIYRDVNILGALALAGAAVVLPPAAAGVAAGWAGFNAVQAGGGEWFRHYSKRKRLKKAVKG